MAIGWCDPGFITALRPHGESSAILSILTAHHGLHKGVVRFGARDRGILQLGNAVYSAWRARLEGSLGRWTLELAHPYAPEFFVQPGPLYALQAACQWVGTVLPEREPCPDVFTYFGALLEGLRTSGWAGAFVRFEVALLQARGVGLDFSVCAVTGARTGLAYVSKRTGRAVVPAVGALYTGQVLALPAFLTTVEQVPPVDDAIAGLALTHYFFEHHVLSHCPGVFPPARAMLQSYLVQEGSRKSSWNS